VDALILNHMIYMCRFRESAWIYFWR